VEAPFDVDSQSIDFDTIGTLDFFGKPRVVLKKNDVFFYKHNV
jgi:hypothetical protein